MTPIHNYNIHAGQGQLQTQAAVAPIAMPTGTVVPGDHDEHLQTLANCVTTVINVSSSKSPTRVAASAAHASFSRSNPIATLRRKLNINAHPPALEAAAQASADDITAEAAYASQ